MADETTNNGSNGEEQTQEETQVSEPPMFEQLMKDNTWEAWAVAGGVALVTFVILRILKGKVGEKLVHFAGRTSSKVDDWVHALFSKTNFFFLLAVSIWVGAHFLQLGATADRYLNYFVIFFFFLQTGIWGNAVIHISLTEFAKRRDDPTTASATVPILTFILQVALWSLVFMLALQNMGIHIGPILAGMGIGGIAVALAMQNILGDLFASMAIVLDKPFEVGDFIIVGELLGTVEKVGIKTTRVRSLFGEQVVFANSDLLGSRVRNFKRMKERRIVFSIGVTYDTQYEHVAEIPGMIRKVIEDLEGARFDRAHFQKYGDSSLDFEVVYFVLTGDYNAYMDCQQAINLEILKQFREKGIEFAFPTRTLYLNQENAE